MTSSPHATTSTDDPHNGAENLSLHIRGMTCGACVGRVRQALEQVDGVAQADVNLLTESALIRGYGISRDRILSSIRAAGYDADDRPVAAPGASSDSEQSKAVREHRQAAIMALQIGLPVIALDYFGPELQAPGAVGNFTWRLIQLVLTGWLLISPAAGPMIASAIRTLRHRSANMDVLIATGVLAAFSSSVFGVFAREGHFVHLHAAAMIIILVSIGRYLEARARGSALSAMSALATRIPRDARVRDGDAVSSKPRRDVQPGDVLVVATHETVPVDGQIVTGEATLDLSMITGEPMPIHAAVGTSVRAGAVVTDGVIDVRADRAGNATTLDQILALLNSAQSSRTRMQRLADQLAAVFTPIVILSAIATLIGWLIYGRADALPHAIAAAVSVLVVACPCAMGLAAPTAIVVATGQAALRGILVRDAAALEALGRVDLIAWDKTGTLTAGRPTVHSVRMQNDASALSEDEILRLAAAAESFATHPVAVAIVAEARQRSLTPPLPSEYKSVVGQGITATVDGHNVVVGSRQMLASADIGISKVADTTDDPIGTRVWVAVDGQVAACLLIDDPIRPSAVNAIKALSSLGVENLMITGDAAGPAQRVAAEVGIRTIHAESSPQDKLDIINALKKSGRRVAMIGDGVNDAAALAAADVGLAFAAGSEVAVSSADITLHGSTPYAVLDAIALGRRSVRIIKQNFFWALIYNLIMLPAAATGHIPAGIAAGAMMFSSLSVVLNSLRLKRFRGHASSDTAPTVDSA